MIYTREQLQTIYNTFTKITFKSELYYYLINNTPLLPGKVFPKQRLWHIINNTMEIPKCKTCGKEVKWDDAQPFIKQQYREFCSVTCGRKHKDTSAKKAQTELGRYGKGRKEVVKKIKETNLKKYGVDFAIQTEEYKQKKVDTVIKRYDVENVIQHPDFLEKREETNLKRFGTLAPAQCEIIKDKMKQTWMERYGSHPGQLQISADSLGKLLNYDWMYDQHIVQQQKMSEMANLLGVHQATILRHLQSHNISVQYYSNSVMEEELANWIETNNINTIKNSQQIICPQELDIYLPDYNLAIEFDGIYWHSELQGKNNNYHLSKTIKCNEKNIRLIHIFENEWVLKQNIVRSRLKSILGLNQKIFARKCKIVTLISSQYTSFFNTTHIQGSAGASICYGLEHEGEIVCAMSFGKSRFNKGIDYELIRYSNKLDTNVIGGAGRLFQQFLREYSPKSIISYSDVRWNTGNLYKQLGFSHSHNTKPNYFYFHSSNHLELRSRQLFQKHKLPNILEGFDSKLTEWQNMVNHGYNRIWDCGNSVWVYKN